MKNFTFAALAVPLMWVLLLLLFFNSNKLHAQETIVLGGVVKSVDGMPLEGVTVWQNDTDNATQTNQEGWYSLEVQRDSYVSFEYLGFKTQTIRVTGKVLNLTLVADNDTLEELVINAGYYNVKDKERTGSIAKITSKEIGQQPIANPLAAMQGRMAGVNITQSSGTPGGGFDIQIRGRNSLRTEGNAPLYIVDGVPYAGQSNADQELSSGIMPLGNVSPLNSLNPNDIESIEVLKDADATAIYGSRGSNGVVLITTKKGTTDRTTFSLQSHTAVSTVSKYMDLMHTQQYLQMRRDAFANSGIAEYPENAYDINGTWDQHRYTDWQKEFIGGKAVSQNTQFSVGGGSGQTSYLFSATHRKDGTVYPGDFGYRRTNFMLNVNHQSKDSRFNFQGSVQKNDQDNKLMAIDLTTAVFLPPNAPALYDEQGTINWENNTFENPLAKLNAQYLSETSDLIAQLNLSYEVANNIRFSLLGGATRTQGKEIRTMPSTMMNPSLQYTSANSSVNVVTLHKESWIVEPKLNYSYSNDNARLEVLLGSTFEERSQDVLGLSGSNFLSNDFITNIQSAATQRITKDTETRYRYHALFARVNYTHKDKYILNVTARRDGSSRFGSNKKWGNFGALGAAWLFSREKVLEYNSWLSFGKLRASYGIAGNDLIGDYQYLNTLGLGLYTYDGKVTLEPLRLYNPDFSWETNKKLEAALELEFFNGKLAASAAWYRNRSSNQLVGIPLPGTTGFPSVQANLGATVENRGWEFTLRSSNLQKEKWSWNTRLNLTIPRNELIAFPNLEQSTYANQYEIGKPVTIRKMYRYTGINPETGLFEFEDTNNDGKIDLNDRTLAMDVGVRFYGGIHNSFQYKNWSLDFLLQFVKQKAFSPDFRSNLLGEMENKNVRAGSYFGSGSEMPSYQQPSLTANNDAYRAYQNFANSDQVVIDGSYIRLKSLQLQYAWKIPQLAGISFNTFLQGQNLITFTKFWGSDPETALGFLPALRTISFGVTINF